MRPRSNRASAATRSHVSFHGSNWISIPDKPTRNSEKSYFQSRSWSFALQGIEESCHEQLMRESTLAILAASLFEPHGLVRLSSKAFLPTCGSFPVEIPSGAVSDRRQNSFSSCGSTSPHFYQCASLLYISSGPFSPVFALCGGP